MYARETIEAARTADLYDYLMTHHGGEVKREHGGRLRIPGHGGLFVRKGYYGFYHASGARKHGDSIDCLTEFFGYSFKEAVEALANGFVPQTEPKKVPETVKVPREAPKPFKGGFKRVFAYLIKTRGLSAGLVSELVRRGLLYEDEKHNAVFINPQKTKAEIRGTCSYVRFPSEWHSVGTDYVFYQPEGTKCERVYICESIIDALSLYLLIKDRKGVYISTQGTGNCDRIINQLKNRREVIICTDNDEYGNAVRLRHPECREMTPHTKDWNDDLRGGMRDADCRSEAVS